MYQKSIYFCDNESPSALNCVQSCIYSSSQYQCEHIQAHIGTFRTVKHGIRVNVTLSKNEGTLQVWYFVWGCGANIDISVFTQMKILTKVSQNKVKEQGWKSIS